jgi:DNA processing protein
MDNKKFWVGFNHVKGIGAVRLRQLISFFGSLEAAWHAPTSALYSAGLPKKVTENLLIQRNSLDLSRILEEIRENRIEIVTWDDENYPRRLKEIDNSPPVLYIRGSLEIEDDWAVGIVGTRRVTSYGRQVAEEIAAFLARNGVTVVSGLARGIDAIAHKAALKHGGRTIAVLGSGVDQLYPPEHRQLALEMIENGAVISDYAPGTPPDAGNFPPRNRIISGLSLAVIVVEAGQKSGALITSTFAAEQGRDVYAVPGNIYSPQSKGTNFLIQQGARPLIDLEDILETLNIERMIEHQSARRVLPSNSIEAKIAELLDYEPAHIDEIIDQSGFSIEDVSSALALMELKGMVKHVGGMHYVIARETLAQYGKDNQ